MAEQKKLKMASPKGVAQWPHLCTPDTKWKKEGEYHVKLRYADDDPLMLAMKDKLMDLIEAKFDEVYKGLKPREKETLEKVDPFHEVYDRETDEYTGLVEVRFKSGTQYTDKKTGEVREIKPSLFDGKRPPNKITGKINIGNGSVLKVSFSPVPYHLKDRKTNEVGITLYINAVQILKLVEYGGSAPDFGDEEEGEFDASAIPAGSDVDNEFGDDEDAF